MGDDVEGGGVWWPSPYGPGRCLVCPARAVVVLVDAAGDKADLCAAHWRYARRIFAIRGVRLVGEDITDDG